jgi:hypothetical protein
VPGVPGAERDAAVNSRGLAVVPTASGPGLCCGLDCDPYDGKREGATAATNIIDYHALLEAAYLERRTAGSGARPMPATNLLCRRRGTQGRQFSSRSSTRTGQSSGARLLQAQMR